MPKIEDIQLWKQKEDSYNDRFSSKNTWHQIRGSDSTMLVESEYVVFTFNAKVCLSYVVNEPHLQDFTPS